MAPPLSAPVLLFDDECALCHRIVRLLLRLDGEGRLRFAALQSATGQAFLRAHDLPTNDFDSLVFIPDWSQPGRREFLLRTDGMLAALRTCGGLGDELAAVLALWPLQWRNAAYRLVARWRHRVFGKWQPQPLARPEWAARFLP